jgi:hypothetical protein
MALHDGDSELPSPGQLNEPSFGFSHIKGGSNG